MLGTGHRPLAQLWALRDGEEGPLPGGQGESLLVEDAGAGPGLRGVAGGTLSPA